MFKAIRDFFSGSDDETGTPRRRRRKARRWIQLFAFEFVVVLLGVLAAQLLQDWFAERRDARRAQEVVAAFDREANGFATVAEYRVRAHDCEMARLARLNELIRTGGTATEAERETPLMPMPSISEWSDDTRQIVARHSSPEAISRYDALSLLAQMISERQRQLEDQWADFRLLAPEARDSADKGTLSLAAARSSGLLSAIDMNAAYLRVLAPSAQANHKRLEQYARMDHPCAAAALRPVTPAGP